MIPDLLTVEIEEARQRLLSAGFSDISVLVTRPPVRQPTFNAPETGGILRVIRQTILEGDRVELVVAHER